MYARNIFYYHFDWCRSLGVKERREQAVAFVDILKLLYERANHAGEDELTSQKAFGSKHGVSRTTMNLWINGKKRVPPRAIWQILEREGYKFEDCIFLPDLLENLPKKHAVAISRFVRLLDLKDSLMPRAITRAINVWYEDLFGPSLPPEGSKKPGGKSLP